MHPMYTLGFKICLDKIFPSVAANIKFHVRNIMLMNIQRQLLVGCAFDMLTVNQFKVWISIQVLGTLGLRNTCTLLKEILSSSKSTTIEGTGSKF